MSDDTYWAACGDIKAVLRAVVHRAKERPARIRLLRTLLEIGECADTIGIRDTFLSVASELMSELTENQDDGERARIWKIAERARRRG